MTIVSRWIAPAALAVGLGFAAMTPAPAQAQDALTRVLVDLADVVFNNGTPYYRYGNYGYDDRLVAGRDRYGRTVYYRQVPYAAVTRPVGYDRYGRPIYGQYRHDRSAPPYGNAYGYYRNGPRNDRFQDRHGRGHDDERDGNDRGWRGRGDHERGDHDGGDDD